MNSSELAAVVARSPRNSPMGAGAHLWRRGARPKHVQDVHHHFSTQQELAAMFHKPGAAAGRCFRGRQEHLDLPRRVPTLLSKTQSAAPDQRGPALEYGLELASCMYAFRFV